VESSEIRDDWVYVVTDIEVDGPWPGANSMRSFASVAVTANAEECGTFEAVLEPLPGAAPNPNAYAWFQTEPEAWAAATTDPRPVPEVMAQTLPPDWLGHIEHTHRAIEDARGYAHLLGELFRRANE
jgi:hypothetical protein